MSNSFEVQEQTTYRKLLDEVAGNHFNAEQKLIDSLAGYTSNNFDELKWVEKREGFSQDAIVCFEHALKEYGPICMHLAKLYVILIRKRKGPLSGFSGLKQFFKFLKIKRLTLKNINKKSLLLLEEWLNTYQKKDAKPYVESTKASIYGQALQFISILQGHPSVATIKNIEIIVNPYSFIKSDDERFKVIPDEQLELLDKCFSNPDVPLQNRVYYWIMRLYGARPEDVTNFPLECVKRLDKTTASMKVYVGKQGGATHDIDSSTEHPYKMELLSMEQEQMKMLYELIYEQQEKALYLQDKALKKGLLLTYTYVNTTGEHVANLRADSFRINFWKHNIRVLFPSGEAPMIKSLRHTAISKRTAWGFSNEALRDVANHQGYDSIDHYSKPSKEVMNKLQTNLLIYEDKRSKNGFKGTPIHNADSIRQKIQNDPYAHELPDLGFCPDVNSCGNHFICIGCEMLVPDKKLTNYYLNQAIDWQKKSEIQESMGRYIFENDSMVRAMHFYSLYERANKYGVEIIHDNK